MAGKIYLLLTFLMICFSAYSQCGKSVGSPVYSQTFGQGTSNIGVPLPNGVTNLQYIYNTCPVDGYYTILRETKNCFGNVWHTLTDHTGDGGYFMLINCSTQPSDFFVQTVKNLCAGTTFEFSAWIVNMVQVSGYIEPNVTFTVESTDGTVLSSYQTGSIPVTNPVQWTKYSFDFTTPAGVTDVVLRMHNNVLGGVGNDLALDDIAFSPVGPETSLNSNGPAGSAIAYPCVGGLVLSANVGSCYVQTAYQWQVSPNSENVFSDIPGANNPTDTVPVPPKQGTYFYRVCVANEGNINSENCRAFSDTIQVNYFPNAGTTYKDITTQTCQYVPYVLPSGRKVVTAGSYADTVKNQGGCDSIVTALNLTIIPQDVLANLGPSRDLCLGDSVTLNPGSFVTYLWQDGTTTPVYLAKSPGKYKVTVTDVNGCPSADSVIITQVYCSTIRPPNAFTPNGDGINDKWNIVGLQYFLDCTVMVYNRAGQVVFKSTGYTQPWDGKYGGQNLPVGTYYYVISLKTNSPPLSGYVTLIR